MISVIDRAGFDNTPNNLIMTKYKWTGLINRGMINQTNHYRLNY